MDPSYIWYLLHGVLLSHRLKGVVEHQRAPVWGLLCTDSTVYLRGSGGLLSVLWRVGVWPRTLSPRPAISAGGAERKLLNQLLTAGLHGACGFSQQYLNSTVCASLASPSRVHVTWQEVLPRRCRWPPSSVSIQRRALAACAVALLVTAQNPSFCSFCAAAPLLPAGQGPPPVPQGA